MKDEYIDMKMGYTIKEAARLMGVSPKTIRNRIKDGTLDANKAPGQYGDTWIINELPAGVEVLPEAIKQESKAEMAEHIEILTKELERLKEHDQELERKNLEMARLLGNFEAENRRLNEQVKLLAAPKQSWLKSIAKKLGFAR